MLAESRPSGARIRHAVAGQDAPISREEPFPAAIPPVGSHRGRHRSILRAAASLGVGHASRVLGEAMCADIHKWQRPTHTMQRMCAPQHTRKVENHAAGGAASAPPQVRGARSRASCSRW
jgi:hypothetical protein